MLFYIYYPSYEYRYTYHRVPNLVMVRTESSTNERTNERTNQRASPHTTVEQLSSNMAQIIG